MNRWAKDEDESIPEEEYKHLAICKNCGEDGMLILKKGVAIRDAECPSCLVKSIVPARKYGTAPWFI